MKGYSEQLKQRLIKAVEGGKSLARASEDLDVPYSTAYDWVQKARKATESVTLSESETDESHVVVMMGASELRKLEGTRDAYRTALLTLIQAV